MKVCSHAPILFSIQSSPASHEATITSSLLPMPSTMDDLSGLGILLCCVFEWSSFCRTISLVGQEALCSSQLQDEADILISVLPFNLFTFFGYGPENTEARRDEA